LDFRPQWDKKSELIEEIKEYRTNCLLVHHHVNESIMNLPCREYIDKKVYFTNKEADSNDSKRQDDDIYLYITSTPDEIFSISTKYQRADSIIGINIIGRGTGIGDKN